MLLTLVYQTENDCKKLDHDVQKLAEKSPYNIYAHRAAKQQQQQQKSNPTTTTTTTTNNNENVLSNKSNNTAPTFTSSTASIKSSTSASLNHNNRINFRRGVAGYVRNDPRHSIRANRAGTRGFRAPEVLMRYTKQTCGKVNYFIVYNET